MTTILVVDDEPMFRDYLRTILVREGYKVIEAGDGNEALHKLDSNQVDLVITDIVMPNKDGIEFLMDLGKRKDTVGVIAVSGGGRPSGCYLIPAKALGATKALAKPFARNELMAAIDEVLNQVTLN
jgi:DNA-binding response OmpR family regulator